MTTQTTLLIVGLGFAVLITTAEVVAAVRGAVSSLRHRPAETRAIAHRRFREALARWRAREKGGKRGRARVGLPGLAQ